LGLPPPSAETEQGGNGKFRLLNTVDEAFEVMFRAIDAARESIRFEVYIYRISPIGERFREALIRARQRNVRVQVLVDALGSISLPEKFWDPLLEAGGEFRWFNPLKFKRLGFRDHRKLLVIDNEIGFIGGFNVAPEYQGDGIKQGWHDLGMEVSPSIARELAASFDWMFKLADHRHRRLARYRRSDIAKVIQTPDGELLTNAPGRGRHFLITSLLNDMNRASTLNIISAYFLPPRLLRRALTRAARNGRRVRLIMAGKSDVLLAQMACHHLYKGLLQAGVEIYEYMPQILHTKLYLFDDVIYAGSANMDKRSLLVNYELLVRVRNTELAREGMNFFETALTNCRRIEPAHWKSSRNFWNRLKERWAYFLLSRVDPYLTRLQLEVLYREIEVDRHDAQSTGLTY
jgi:cardiolipin synthase